MYRVHGACVCIIHIYTHILTYYIYICIYIYTVSINVYIYTYTYIYTYIYISPALQVVPNLLAMSTVPPQLACLSSVGLCACVLTPYFMFVLKK